MEIKQVIFYALILLTFYLLYQYFINDSTKIDLINMHQDCKSQKDIPTSLLPNNHTNMNFICFNDYNVSMIGIRH